jgi:hypothetical protein
MIGDWIFFPLLFNLNLTNVMAIGEWVKHHQRGEKESQVCQLN